jgi:hypothetical protein
MDPQCVFAGNRATRGGGLCVLNATALVTDSNFTTNIVSDSTAINIVGTGAGIHARKKLVVNGGHFIDNKASAAGGAIEIYSDSTAVVYDYEPRSITGAVFRGNTAFGSGSNAVTGGAVDVGAACVDITDCDFSDNVADVYGGALSLSSSLAYDCLSSVMRSRFSHNSAGYGGGMGALSVNRVVVSEVCL